MDSHSLKAAAADLWSNTRAALHNLRCRLKPAQVDYIVFTLSGSLPEYIPPTPSWQRLLPFPLPGSPGGPSLTGLRNAFDQIANDPRPVGVLIQLYGLEIGWATAQSLRDAMSRLRERGKKIAVHAPYFDILSYFVAAAADTVIAPPPGIWDVSGLRAELTFLKDAFNAWGVQAEVVNVSPYKTAWDTYTRSDISPEHRAMIEWLMDGRYETIVNAVAAGRKLEPARVRELIDSAPLTIAAARENGLIDAALYEDELAEYLATPEQKAKAATAKPTWRDRLPLRKKGEEKKEPPKARAQIKRWSAVWASLRRPIRWRSGKRIAVIPLEGIIVSGRTPQVPPIPFPIPIPIPFVEEQVAGSETVAQHFRDAEKDDEIAAIVFYVNSRGGSAIASDLIWREMERARRKKPVVVCMGDYAASGGYFVSATAEHIMAQPLTITGSIGVIALKIVTAGLYEKFQANRVVMKRGANEGLFADDAPWTPELRAVAQAQTDAYYDGFKKVVMTGRKMDEPSLEAVAGGRVWLGRQALDHKLVDSLGDLHAAVEKAKEMAKIPAKKWAPPLWYSGSGGNLLPPPFPSSLSQAAEYIALLRLLLREHVWMLDPFRIK